MIEKISSQLKNASIERWLERRAETVVVCRVGLESPAPVAAMHPRIVIEERHRAVVVADIG